MSLGNSIELNRPREACVESSTGRTLIFITIFSTSSRASLTRKPTRIPAARPDQPVTRIRAPEPALVTALEHAATTSTEKGGTWQLKITIFSTSFRASLTRKPIRIPAARPDQPVTRIRAPEPVLVTALEHAATTSTSTEKGVRYSLRVMGLK